MSRECDTCPEYKDYHCEKWCTVIRQTIADMEEDWIPIEWIGDWLYDHPALQRTETEINIMLMITDWKAEQERESNGNSE